jgi:hypothetical protein
MALTFSKEDEHSGSIQSSRNTQSSSSKKRTAIASTLQVGQRRSDVALSWLKRDKDTQPSAVRESQRPCNRYTDIISAELQLTTTNTHTKTEIQLLPVI